MVVTVTVFILGTTLCSLVEAGCQNLNPLKKDYDATCMQWWDKGMEYEDGGKRKECIKLINENCSYMIVTERSTSRRWENIHFEIWSTRVLTILASDSDKWMIYYDEVKHPICWDNNGKVAACNYWWEVAKYEKHNNEDKELCINRILQHCGNIITKAEEVTLGEVQRRNKNYNVIKVIYKKEETDRASYDRYDLVKK